MGGGATTATRGGGGAGGAGGAGAAVVVVVVVEAVALRRRPTPSWHHVTLDGRHCARTTGTPPATASANAITTNATAATTVHLPLFAPAECGVCLSDVETLADGRRGADVEEV